MVDFILRVDIDLFAILMLCIVLFTIILKNEMLSYTNTLFRRMLFVNIILLIFEVFSWVFDGGANTSDRFFNYWSNGILILFSPLIGSLWACYIDYNIFKDQKRLKRRQYYLFPMYVSAILFIINFFVPVLFSVSAANVYTREPLLWLNLISVYILYGYLVYITVKYRKRLKQQLIIGTVLFLALPAIGSVLQLLALGLLLIWPLMALALVYAYVFVERQSLAIDSLTGLYNRSKADDYIEYLVLKDKEFSMVMIDLDNFKEVNDTYGHIAGDQILIEFGKILKDELDENGSVFRFGGDEFLVVTDKLEKKDVHQFVRHVRSQVSQLKEVSHIHSLRFSYGVHTVTKPEELDVERYFVKADDLMYQNKSNNKNYKLRKDD